jgi:hypothetical protein
VVGKDFFLWLLGILLCIAVPAAGSLIRPAPQPPRVRAWRPLTKAETARRKASLETMFRLQERYGHLALPEWQD